MILDNIYIDFYNSLSETESPITLFKNKDEYTYTIMLGRNVSITEIEEYYILSEELENEIRYWLVCVIDSYKKLNIHLIDDYKANITEEDKFRKSFKCIIIDKNKSYQSEIPVIIDK